MKKVRAALGILVALAVASLVVTIALVAFLAVFFLERRNVDLFRRRYERDLAVHVLSRIAKRGCIQVCRLAVPEPVLARRCKRQFRQSGGICRARQFTSGRV